MDSDQALSYARTHSADNLAALIPEAPEPDPESGERQIYGCPAHGRDPERLHFAPFASG
jgi:hypothetical protein